MKRSGLSLILLLIFRLAFADGLITNGSHSAQYARMLSRNASMGIDAAFYNPAGLSGLENGLHLAFSNQVLFGTKTVKSGYTGFNNHIYTEKNRQWLIPSGVAAYKRNDWVFSLAMGQAGSLGSVNYDLGLPSLEVPVTKLKLDMPAAVRSSYDLNGYVANNSFDGSSAIWGFQPGVTFRINEYLSVYGGLRILTAKNEYVGGISSIRLVVGTDTVAAPAWMTATSDEFKGLAEQNLNVSKQFNSAATSLQQLVTMGAGAFTISQVQAAGYISSAQAATYTSGLMSLGFSPAQIAAMNIKTIQTHYKNGATEYHNTSVSQNNAATRLLEMVSSGKDNLLETSQNGFGFSPVFGVHVTPISNLAIGVRYEMKAKIHLANQTVRDDFGLYPENAETILEMPAVLGVGIGYQPANRLRMQLSFTNYFDKGVDWGKNFRDRLVYPKGDSLVRPREIDHNSFELGLGLETGVTDNLSVSLGASWFKPGVAESFQSDFHFASPALSIGGGFNWKITADIALDAGLTYSFYQDAEASFFDLQVEDGYWETYKRNTMRFAIGLSYRMEK